MTASIRKFSKNKCFARCRPKMVWSAQHDVMLCREILLAQPFQHKFGSRERGHAWDEVADRLSTISDPKFYVDQRAV